MMQRLEEVLWKIMKRVGYDNRKRETQKTGVSLCPETSRRDVKRLPAVDPSVERGATMTNSLPSWSDIVL